jgi:urate oxidase
MENKFIVTLYDTDKNTIERHIGSTNIKDIQSVEDFITFCIKKELDNLEHINPPLRVSYDEFRKLRTKQVD